MYKINLITPEDIAAFDRIDRDCLKMHVCPPPKTFINMKVHDKHGLLISELDMVSRSWVRNAYNILTTQVCGLRSNLLGNTYGAGTLNIKTTAALGKDTPAMPYLSAGSVASFIGGAGVTTQGIVVGTGTGAESFESYILETLILNGNAAGKLSYAAQESDAQSYNSGTKKFTIIHERIINNNSGGSIDISEVGMIGLYTISTASNVLLCRDLLGSSVPLANGAQLTVTYTMEMTFPA